MVADMGQACFRSATVPSEKSRINKLIKMSGGGGAGRSEKSLISAHL
jgi:hypothetical protein